MTNHLQNGGIPGLEKREGQGIINTGDLYKEVTRVITHRPQIGIIPDLKDDGIQGLNSDVQWTET